MDALAGLSEIPSYEAITAFQAQRVRVEASMKIQAAAIDVLAEQTLALIEMLGVGKNLNVSA